MRSGRLDFLLAPAADVRVVAAKRTPSRKIYLYSSDIGYRLTDAKAKHPRGRSKIVHVRRPHVGIDDLTFVRTSLCVTSKSRPISAVGTSICRRTQYGIHHSASSKKFIISIFRAYFPQPNVSCSLTTRLSARCSIKLY